MSNTYFRIEKEVKYEAFPPFTNSDYVNKYELSLTAFVGNNLSGNVQLTIQTNSTLNGQSGTAYITLSDEDIDKLIFGLLERKLRIISATGDEQSKICPDEEIKG
jgi:hypothetical protein